MTSPTSMPPSDAQDPEDPLLAELGDAVVTLARALQHGAHERADVIPLTGTEVMVLRWVDRHPGATPSSTAQGVGLRRSNLSAAVRGLVAKGMLTREADPADSRSVRLAPTDRARESSRAIRAHWGRELAARLPDLTAADREVLARTVRILGRDEGPAT